eukprot:2065902-Rhodomonas_salina.3
MLICLKFFVSAQKCSARRRGVRHAVMCICVCVCVCVRGVSPARSSESALEQCKYSRHGVLQVEALKHGGLSLQRQVPLPPWHTSRPRICALTLWELDARVCQLPSVTPPNQQACSGASLVLLDAADKRV